MKKIVLSLMILCLLLTLCSCKSKEAQNVDDMILAIGEVSLESKSSITDAEKAYNALTDKDKESVEYYSLLTEAQKTIADLEEKAAIEARIELKENQFASLTERLSELNHHCDTVSGVIYQIWDNVGASDFYTYFNSVLMLQSEEALESLKNYHSQQSSGQNGWIVPVALAGKALAPELYGDIMKLSINDDEQISDIVQMCSAFNSIYNILLTASDELSEDISAFIKEYKTDFQEESELLREWNLESSMYAEFAYEPSGSLASYRNEMNEYQDAMSRFQKEAESLK